MELKECSENKTSVTKFLLMGFLVPPLCKPLLFLIFTVIYLFTIAGNLTIVVAVSAHDRLRSPMYFFLANLSFLEIWYVTNPIPTTLEGFLLRGSTISLSSCLTQCFFAGLFLGTECFLLTVMAYDRYVAICYPLHYSTLMEQQLCIQLAGISWAAGFIIALAIIMPLAQKEYSGFNVVDHYFCDLAPILQAVCSDTSFVEIEIFVLSVFVLLIPFPVIIVSYTSIILTIMKIPSAIGREKAFSTCSSHLAVVITYFATLITTYCMPKSGHLLNLNKICSLLYTMGTPMLNPIIYALRNKEIKETLRCTIKNDRDYQ